MVIPDHEPVSPILAADSRMKYASVGVSIQNITSGIVEKFQIIYYKLLKQMYISYCQLYEHLFS